MLTAYYPDLPMLGAVPRRVLKQLNLHNPKLRVSQQSTSRSWGGSSLWDHRTHL